MGGGWHFGSRIIYLSQGEEFNYQWIGEKQSEGIDGMDS